MSNTVVTIGAPSGQTQVSVSSADIIYVSVAAGFTGQGGGGGGGANLSTTRTATTVTVLSDSGTDATIPAADGSNAGVMTAAMQTKLAGIEAGAEVNDTASEILTKLLTVDGSGSGLDADTLDGYGSNAFALASHTHVIGDVTGLQTALDGKAATVHTHVIGDVTGLQTALDGKAATVHTHVIGDVTNLQTTLDGKVDENASITGATKTKITYDSKGLVTAGTDAAIADITGLQTALDGKVDENAAIVGATKTKITYDAKGLVTAGTDATTADIADSTNKRYVTDAQLTVIGNTSGTNTGDQNLFGKVAVSGQSDVVADSTNDTLTLVAGSNITITTDASTDSITIASTGGGGGVSDGDKGDITVSSSGTVWTVDNDAITYAKLQNVSATSRFLGRISSGAGDAEELTGTQATTLLDTFTSSLKGLAPASGGGTTNFLRADGTWAAPAGGGGSTGLTILNQDFTQKGPQNSTTETALYSYTLPTDLVAGDALRLDLSGFYKNNSGSARSIFFYVKLGATTVFSFNPTIGVHSTERPGTMMLNIAIVATNSQKIALTGWSTDLGQVGSTPGYLTTSSASMYNFIGYNTCAEDLTSAKTLQVTVRFQLANADLYWYSQMATLTKLPKP